MIWAQKLFLQLAAEEDLHRKKFEEIYKAIQAKQSWPNVGFKPHQGGQQLKTLFATAGKDVKPSANELEAVQTAMTMENKTRDFYREQAKKASLKRKGDIMKPSPEKKAAHHAAL